MRLSDAAGGSVFDLLFASSGIEPEVVQAARVLDLIEGLSLPVAVPGHLVALKILSRDDRTRPQDALDLRALISLATDDDLALAEGALDLILLRGYDRGRNLRSLLREAIAAFRLPETP